MMRNVTILTLIASGLLFLPPQGSANSGSQCTITIAQDRLRVGGVLISRPQRLDMQIKDILRFNDICNIDSYADWLKKNIHYEAENNTDDYLTPEETLARKSGDCEDLAFLNKAFLRVLGFKPEVLAVLKIFKNHAICVFKEGNYYSVIDNTRLLRTKAANKKELARYLFNRYRCASIAKIHIETKDWDILFRKSDIEVSG